MTVEIFLLIAVVLPFLGGVAAKVICKDNSMKSGLLSSVISLAVLISGIALYPEVYAGNAVFTVRGFFIGDIVFRVTPIGYVFVLLSSIVWFAASLFSIVYMENNHYQGRFYMFFLFTLGSTLGVFLSGDMIALFTFFEIMSLVSFMLVIHEQDHAAVDAGNLYIFMSVFGSLMALMGLFMLYHSAGTLDIIKLGQVLQGMGNKKYLIYFSIVFGFGVKAGMFPFHVWLPKAHPAAPSPASAILSGILLKTGIYGILIASMVFMGQSSGTGKTIMVFGAVTMIGGAASALRSSNFKRLLAYSSMSQMGYVIMSIGSSLVLGKNGWLGYAGGIYQAVNHGIYEAMLFLMAGYLLLAAGSIELGELKGFARRDRSAGLFLIIGLAAISGFPGLNGFVGKTLIHDSLLEAMHENHGIFYYLSEKAFMLGSALTAAYCFKLTALLFSSSRDISSQAVMDKRRRSHVLVNSSFGILSLAILVTGIMPGGLIGLMSPALSHLHYHPIHLYSIGTLTGSASVYILGFVIYLLYRKLAVPVLSNMPPEEIMADDAVAAQRTGLSKDLVSERINELEEGIGEASGRFSKNLKLLFNWILRAFGFLDRSFSFQSKGTGFVTALFGRIFGVISRFFLFLDTSFSFEGNVYRPIIKQTYKISSKVFGIIDRGADFFYTFFTSFLTGIYHREDDQAEESVVIEIRERGVLYKKYTRVFREIMHGHFREAGVLVSGFFRDKEYNSFNLNVGVILFAAIVVIFMLIFVMYVPILTDGVLKNT